MANHNIRRLTEDVRREICAALREIKDKKITENIVTISHIELTSDLSYCKVYVSCLNGGEKTADIAKTLQNAEGFFKREINKRVKMRKLPELIFLPDNSQDYYEKISGILENIPLKSEDEDE